MTSFEAQIAKTVADSDFGVPSARKTGRNPRFPYVPVIKHVDDRGVGFDRAEQITGRAHVTREEAVQEAARVIEWRRQCLAEKLALREYRALRRHHGLPYELPQDAAA